MSEEQLGPVEFMMFGFPGNRFRGEIGPALGDLVDAGTIRILDITFLTKDADGNVAGLEVTDLEPEVQAGLERLGAGGTGLFSEEDRLTAAEELDPDCSAALIVWEDVWAKEVADAIAAAGGVVVGHDRIPREVVAAAREYITANA